MISCIRFLQACDYVTYYYEMMLLQSDKIMKEISELQRKVRIKITSKLILIDSYNFGQ